jgi:exodeoxyribonuclease V beta subunit
MKPLDPFLLDLEKITLIEASAGTGKTYTITTLFARLIAQGYSIESILVVTFTEAAAAELKLRIRKRLSNVLAADVDDDDYGNDTADNKTDELTVFFNSQPEPELIRQRIAHAVTCFDQACIMTIHSFCFQTLKDNAFESRSPFDMELLTDSSHFFDQVCMDFFMTRINDQDSLFLKFLAQKGVTPESLKASFRPLVSRPNMDIIPDIARFEDVCDSYRNLTQKIHIILKTQKQDIIKLIQDHKGLDKRSYSKKNLPKWLDLSLEKLEVQGRDTLFVMTEKGDPIYKFTSTRLASKIKEGHDFPFHELFALSQDLVDLTRVLETNVISLKLEFFSFFNQELEKMKLTQGACFFDDLVNDLASALEGDGKDQLRAAVHEKFRACLIDEFQDTDPAQYQIFSRLFEDYGISEEKMPFFMIGDPKQAIYGFRGGDIFAYLFACKKSDQMFTLEKNYRSGPLLVKAVNDIFCLTPNPFLFKEIEYTRVKTPETAVNRLNENDLPCQPLQFAFVQREDFSLDRQGYIKKADALKAIPKILAQEILFTLDSSTRLLSKNGDSGDDPIAMAITPGDMAVLVRTNDQAEQIQLALSSLNIPSYLSKTGSVFDSQEAIELYDILLAVYEPDQLGLLKAALSSSVFGFSLAMLADLDQDEESMWSWQDRFRGYKDIWEQKGFVSMIMELFHCDDGVVRASSVLSERGLTNFYHLIELVSQEALHHYLSMFYLIKWYKDQLFKDSRGDGADELRLESDKKAVAIVTIHKSKGLEYPIVYLPYLWAGTRKTQGKDPILFHDPDMEYRLRLDLGSPDQERAMELREQEETAEEKRLLYVALTRASAMCCIIWGGFSSVDNSALGSLLHPDGCSADTIMLQNLGRLSRPVDSGEPRIKVSLLTPGEPEGNYIPLDQTKVSLCARSLQRQIAPAWRISSFSAISTSRSVSGSALHPDILKPGDLSGIVNKSTQKICLKDFPKGAGSGDFFHAVFEDLDFIEPSSIEKLVKEKLAKFGFTDESLETPAAAAVKDVLGTSLGTKTGEKFCLKDIHMDQRFTELEFFFNIRSFNIPGISALFAREPQGNAYAKKLLTLGSGGFKGFIKGFIDLVIRHQGKWYIIDYKSNFLGETYGDYGQTAMKEAMESHHYILQYWVYLTALHRYLTLRLKGYSYEKDFGGVFYLFIRGMHPIHPYGIFYHRPPKEFLDKFLALL